MAFRRWEDLRLAIDRTRRGMDELAHAMVARLLEEVEGPARIHLEVAMRVDQADILLGCCIVEDGVQTLEQGVYRRPAVAHTAVNEAEVRAAFQMSDI